MQVLLQVLEDNNCNFNTEKPQRGVIFIAPNEIRGINKKTNKP